MKITINTEVLNRNNISLREFLVLLLGYYDIDYEEYCKVLVEKGLVEPNVFKKIEMVLSDNTRNFVARILTESDDKIQSCAIQDFEALAEILISLYPPGNKPGTTYSWGGNKVDIAQKLRTLITQYDFYFTEEEAINAVKEYVSSFKDVKYMQLLRHFILKTYKDPKGDKEISSMFMTIIEGKRDNFDNVEYNENFSR